MTERDVRIDRTLRQRAGRRKTCGGVERGLGSAGDVTEFSRVSLARGLILFLCLRGGRRCRYGVGMEDGGGRAEDGENVVSTVLER